VTRLDVMTYECVEMSLYSVGYGKFFKVLLHLLFIPSDIILKETFILYRYFINGPGNLL
jgi:hypothetical protein